MAEDDPELEDDLDLDPPVDEVEDEQVDDADEQSDETEPVDDEPEPVAARTEDPAPARDRQPSRGETRIQTLRNEIRDRDARLAETNRRIDELIRAQAQPRTQGESPEQRAARFAIMTPQEQMDTRLNEAEARFTQQLQASQMQNADIADRTAFQAKCASDTLYAKWAPKVEGKRAELLTKGQIVDREVLLKFMIGEAALANRSSPKGKQQAAQGARRVAAQRTRPGNSGSDTQPQRRQQSSVERRLENMNI